MARIELDGLTKTFGDSVAVQDVSLTIEDGELVVLVGPSGCGKSTILRTIAGLETISSGELRIDGRRMNDVDAKDRDIAMVFQNYALYPHMTVAQNIGYPLRMAGRTRAERRAAVGRVADLLQLSGLLDRKPAQLSGGQRQRVAIGRAMVREPVAYLMDEPLSNLDAKLRLYMRTEIAALQKRLGTTTVYVTHDQTEAMTMGDKVAVLRGGLLQQVAEPRTLYNTPDNIFVASFIGAPSMNLIAVPVHGSDRMYAALGATRMVLPDGVAQHVRQEGCRSVVVGIRAEAAGDASAVPAGQGGSVTLEVTALVLEELGSERICFATGGFDRVDTGDADVRELGSAGTPYDFVFKSTSPEPPRLGAPVTVTVRAEMVHYFDPENGKRIR